jgi:hypothetical protein
MMMGRSLRYAQRLAGAIALVSLGACVTNQPVQPLGLAAPPYPILPVDESMSCEAMTASFIFSARRAARLEYWMNVGQLPGYGTDMFGVDAPKEIIAERRRLDALSDLQRTRGCPVMEPVPAVLYERQKLEGVSAPPLRVRG